MLHAIQVLDAAWAAGIRCLMLPGLYAQVKNF